MRGGAAAGAIGVQPPAAGGRMTLSYCLFRAGRTAVGGPFQVPGDYLTDGQEHCQIHQIHPHCAHRGMHDQEVTEAEETDQAREYQRSENLRAAITVFSDLGFHGCERYPQIAALPCAEGHAW